MEEGLSVVAHLGFWVGDGGGSEALAGQLTLCLELIHLDAAIDLHVSVHSRGLVTYKDPLPTPWEAVLRAGLPPHTGEFLGFLIIHVNPEATLL